MTELARATATPLEIHPLAALIPEMSRDEYRELVQSLQLYGYEANNPILTFEGQVLDGRHRQRACVEIGVAPVYKPYEGDAPEEYILLANVHRRHLTTAQRAEIVLEILPAYRERAKQRQRDHGGTAPGRQSNTSGRNAQSVSEAPSSTGDRARDEAAAMLGVSGRTVADLERVKRDAPDLYEEVRSGDLSVSAAARKVKARKEAATPPAASTPPTEPPMPGPPPSRPLVERLDELVFTLVGFADSLDSKVNLAAAIAECTPDELRTYDRRLREARSKLTKFNFTIREARNDGDD